MTEQDIKRYIEFEAPGMGIVDNRPAAVVCYHDDCDQEVPVDPATLVPEDDQAVSVEARLPNSWSTHQVEIYCSPACRNDQYSGGEQA